MSLEYVANLTRDEIESHPLINPEYSLRDYIQNEPNDEQYDYLEMFLALMSMQVHYSEEDGDKIEHLIDTLRERLETLLKYVDVESHVLYYIGENLQCTTIKLILEFFWDTEYRNTLIDGIMSLDEDYKEEREVLEGILNCHHEDIDLFYFIASHDNWRSMRKAIDNAIDSNPLMMEMFIGEGLDEIVNEFN